MDKSKDTGVTLAQANALTQARYNFSVIEKRAVYQIIKEVRRRFIECPEGQRDLFNDLVITLKTSDIQGNMDLKEVYKSLKSLRRKSVWIEDDKRVLEVGYINYFEHKRREPSLEVQVSHKILPFLVELAEQFTTYSLTVAISLRTKYGQRFYEYCAQFRETGFFYIPIPQLRAKLELGNAYSRYSLMKKYVVDVAQKELSELYEKRESDLMFTYTEDKSGRTVLGLKVVVIAREYERKEAPKLEDCMFFIKMWLNTWLATEKKPKNKAWVVEVVKQLQRKPDKIPALYDRLKRLKENEKPSSYAALARHIVEEDYLD